MRHLLQQGTCLALPGVFDGISARVADSIGFPALYMTGYGAVASALGAADAGIATYSEMLERVRCIAGAVSVPFLADGDTGYGGLLNVDRTVRGYAAAGAAGIQLEDQEFPKKCGHTEFRRVIPMADAVAKVRVAVEARPSKDFLIVARTDARYAHGMDEALRRGEAFLEAGADILFVESPESLEELRRVGETFRGALLLANMVEGGRTPVPRNRGAGRARLRRGAVSRHRLPGRGRRAADSLRAPQTGRHRHRRRGAATAVRRDEPADGFPGGARLRAPARPDRRAGLNHRVPAQLQAC